METTNLEVAEEPPAHERRARVGWVHRTGILVTESKMIDITSFRQLHQIYVEAVVQWFEGLQCYRQFGRCGSVQEVFRVPPRAIPEVAPTPLCDDEPAPACTQ